MWFPETDGFIETKTINRQTLPVNHVVTGPALIEDTDSTAVILPNDKVMKHELGHLVIEIYQNRVPEADR